MSNRFTQFILIAMALGIVMGAAIFNFLPDSRAEIASSVNLIAMLFLRLIKMINRALVFATLVGGIAHMGTGSKARTGLCQDDGAGSFPPPSSRCCSASSWSTPAAAGANFPGTLPGKGPVHRLAVSAFSFEKFLVHLVPTSIADAMAQNEILQIVVFAVFLCRRARCDAERSKAIMGLIDDLAHIMLKITGYVMLFAPIAVWRRSRHGREERPRRALKLIVFNGRFYLRS